MFPSRFRYEAPRSLDEAISVLGDGGDYAKVLAGGQSPGPMMKLRFAPPQLIVAINNLPAPASHPARPPAVGGGRPAGRRPAGPEPGHAGRVAVPRRPAGRLGVGAAVAGRLGDRRR